MNTGNSINVKLEWQELNEDDKEDITKLDKYLAELASQKEATSLNYQLIIEYIFARANLAKFIALRLKNSSSSKSKNKKRIMSLIHKMILEKDSEKKQMIMQYLDEYLCQIFLNIFDEYKNDESTIENFKIYRFCWATKISNQTFENMRQEIGNNYFIDIDKGLSRSGIEKVKQYYKNNKIDPNQYLRKAIEELESQEPLLAPVQPPSQQPSQTTSKQQYDIGVEKNVIPIEKPKKKPLPQQPASSQITSKQQGQIQQQQLHQQPLPQQQLLVNQLSNEEKKKQQQQQLLLQQQQRVRKNSNNPDQVREQKSNQQSSKNTGMETLVNNQAPPAMYIQQNQPPSHTIVQTIKKKEEQQTNEGDIQIKKKPKKPIQPSLGSTIGGGISSHIQQSPQNKQHKPSTSSTMSQHKPPTEGINGNTPQKKVKTSSTSSNYQNPVQQPQKNDFPTKPQSQQSQQPSQPPIQGVQNPQQKPIRLPEKMQLEKVKKINDDSKNLKTNAGITLIPTTQSLGYGYGSINNDPPQISQPPPTLISQPHQQQTPSSYSMQLPSSDNSLPYVPGNPNPNLLNTNLPPPLPPSSSQNIPPSSLGQILQKSNQSLDIKQQAPPLLPPNQQQTMIQTPLPNPQNREHSFGSNQEYNLSSSQQKQNLHNKPPQSLSSQGISSQSQTTSSSQGLLPTSSLNYSNNTNSIQHPPTHDQLNLPPNPNNQNMGSNQNIGSLPGISSRPQQDFSTSSQQNQPMYMNQRMPGNNSLDNQPAVNSNMRNKYPPGPNMPFQQPPPPTPLNQLIDNQNNFNIQMDIEGPNNMVRRQQPTFNQMMQQQHQPPPPPPPPIHHQQNMPNINGGRTPQGSSQNLSNSGQIESIQQPPHIIPPYQQPPPPLPSGMPMRQMSQSAYNLMGIQQDKTSLFYELFNFVKPTLNVKQYFLSQIEEMKQNKITYIQPQLFLNRKEEVIQISKNTIYDNLPYQCAQCGIRYAAKDDLRTHLEDHTIKNLKNCQDDDVEKEQESESETEKNYFVPQNKSNGKCDLCQEPFILSWSDENEDWVYENAKRFQIYETSTEFKKIATVHLTCYKVLEKQSELENQGNEEQSIDSTERI